MESTSESIKLGIDPSLTHNIQNTVATVKHQNNELQWTEMFAIHLESKKQLDIHHTTGGRKMGLIYPQKALEGLSHFGNEINLRLK